MTRVRLLTCSAAEIDPARIQERLEKFLIKCREKKLSDERPSGPQALQTTTVPQDRSVALSLKDKARIRKRATRAAREARKSIHPAHLKTDEADRLSGLLPDVEAVSIATVHRADEIAAAIHEDAPWMAPATEVVWDALRMTAARGEPVVVPPLILVGDPGLGKSRWARRLAAMIDLPYVDIDASAGGVGFSLVGTERGWGSAQPGRPVETMLEKRVANPVVVVDEIDKSGGGMSSSGRLHTFSNALLTLLEPDTARRWTCPYFRVGFDMSRISWILTANEAGTVPAPLLSRCQVVHISEPTVEQLMELAGREGARRGLSAANMDAVLTVIGRLVWEQDQSVSVRDVMRVLERAEKLGMRAPVH